VAERAADKPARSQEPRRLSAPLDALASAGALALGLVALYGAFVAGIAVAVADDGLVVPHRKRPRHGLVRLLIPIYFALIGIQLDLIHHSTCRSSWASSPSRVRSRPPASTSERVFRVRAASCRPAWPLHERPRGPGIVLASTAFAAHIINATFFVSLVMLSVVTSLLAGSWLERVAVKLGGAGRQRRRPGADVPEAIEPGQAYRQSSAPPDLRAGSAAAVGFEPRSPELISAMGR